MNAVYPKISIIIPHYNGEAILRRCLLSLKRSDFTDFQIVIVDNGSTDESLKMVSREFRGTVVIQSQVNLGYAGGCNLGIRNTRSPLVLLLNNDTEVTPRCLTELVSAIETSPDIASVQPKIHSFQDRDRFDYSGAAGGAIDIFGYPFAYGRIFDHLEKDLGQYDRGRELFWATGAAMLIRRSVLDITGLLEEDFFAHMEEIDLCWRFHLAGFRVLSQPAALVYHESGATLNQFHVRKMILNHRNSLLMVLRNYSAGMLILIFPVRLLLELMTLGVSLLSARWKRAWAVPAGLFGCLKMARTVSRGRKKAASIRKIRDRELLKRMYRGSVALSFFVGRKKTASQLLNDET